MFDIFGKIDNFFKELLLGAINSNLESMFFDLNQKVGTIASDVSKTPANFNREIFNFISQINDTVVIPVAGLILTAILCMELISTIINKNNMYTADIFDFFRYFIKMWIAVWFVSHSFEFSMAVFDLSQNMITKLAGVINTSANVSESQIIAMLDTLKDKSSGELIVVLFEISIVRLSLQAMSVLIMLITYGRIVEIYIYTSISSVPFATMGHNEFKSIGQNYIKGLFALGLQGVFLMIILGIYAVLISNIDLTNIHTSVFSILGYAVLLGFMMLKTGSISKSIVNAH